MTYNSPYKYWLAENGPAYHISLFVFILLNSIPSWPLTYLFYFMLFHSFMGFFVLQIYCTVLKCFRALLPKHLKGFNEENKISMSRHTLQESLQKVLKLCTTCAFKGIHLSLINVYQCLKARSFIILRFWTLSSIYVENKKD